MRGGRLAAVAGARGGILVPSGTSYGPSADPVQFNDATAPPGATLIVPGDNWQTKATAAGAGGTLYVTAGNYFGNAGAANVVTLNGQRWIAQRDADGTKRVHVDGADQSYLIRGNASTDDVTIRGFDIFNFLPTHNQTAPIQPYPGTSSTDIGDRWDVRFNEIHHTEHVGLRVTGANMKVRGNHIHHVTRIGLGGGQHTNLELAYNDISDNNTSLVDPGFEAGGFKFVLGDDAWIHHNVLRRNHGASIWFDIAMVRGTIEDNLIEDDPYEGVFVEISFGPTIVRRNTIRRCGSPGWFPIPAIMVSSSTLVEVYDNVLEDVVHGIIGQQQSRNEEPVDNPRGLTVAGKHRLSDLNVHDNTVRFVTGSTGTRNFTGLAVDYHEPGAPDVWTARNIHFTANQYFGPAKFQYKNPANNSGAEITFTQWRTLYGHDLTGTLTP